MDIETIEQLICVLEESPNEELCVQKGDYKIHVKKGQRPASAAKQPKVSTKKPVESGVCEPRELFIKAPIVGMFHQSNGLAEVGSEIAEGQIVGSIESMKLPNNITSKVSGIVVEVLVEDGMPVEFGQPLFKLEPL